MKDPQTAATSPVRRICRVALYMMLCTPGAQAQEATPTVDSVVTVASDLLGTHPNGLGGVCVDRLGYTYVADFGEMVWRISPHGDVEPTFRRIGCELPSG